MCVVICKHPPQLSHTWPWRWGGGWATELLGEIEDWAFGDGVKPWLYPMMAVWPWASHLTFLGCPFCLGFGTCLVQWGRVKWIRIHFTNLRDERDYCELRGISVTVGATSSCSRAISGHSKKLSFPPLALFYLNQIPQQVSKWKLWLSCLYQYSSHCFPSFLWPEQEKSIPASGNSRPCQALRFLRILACQSWTPGAIRLNPFTVQMGKLRSEVNNNNNISHFFVNAFSCTWWEENPHRTDFSIKGSIGIGNSKFRVGLQEWFDQELKRCHYVQVLSLLCFCHIGSILLATRSCVVARWLQ